MEQSGSSEIGRKKTDVPEEEDSSNVINEKVLDSSGKEETKLPLVQNTSDLIKMYNDQEKEKEFKDAVEDQKEKDAEKIDMTRANIDKFKSNIPDESESKKKLKVEPMPGGEKKKASPEDKDADILKDKSVENQGKDTEEPVDKGTDTEKPKDAGAEKSRTPEEKESQRNRPSLKTAENLSKQSEKLFELLNSEKGKNMTVKEREKMDKEIRVLKEREAMAIASALTSESVHNARRTMKGDMDLKEFSELALGTKRSVEALQATVMAQIEENRLSNEEKGAIRKIGRLVTGRFGQSKENEPEVPKYGKNKWKMTSYEEGVVWGALKGGKEDKKQKELALKLLLRGTGRESYYDEIIKDAKAEYEPRLLNSGKIRLDVNWKDEEGKERELQFVVDFEVDGEKGGKPGIMKRNFGFLKHHSVEIETTETEFLPPVDAESAKEIKTNYPKTAGFIESYRKIFSSDNEGLREINEVENLLKDGNKEVAMIGITRFGDLTKKGLGRNMWSGQDKKDAEDLVRLAEEAVEELKKEEIARNEDENEETEGEDVKKLKISDIKEGDVAVVTMDDNKRYEFGRSDDGKVHSREILSDGSYDVGGIFEDNFVLQKEGHIIDIKFIKGKKAEDGKQPSEEDEEEKREKRKEELVKKYPELERVTTYKYGDLGTMKEILADALLKSSNAEQLEKLYKRLEKGGARVFTINQSQPVLDGEKIDHEFVKIITGGVWSENDIGDLGDIKRIVGESRGSSFVLDKDDILYFKKNGSMIGWLAAKKNPNEESGDKKEGGLGARQSGQVEGTGDIKKIEIDEKIKKEYPKTAEFSEYMIEKMNEEAAVSVKAEVENLLGQQKEEESRDQIDKILVDIKLGQEKREKELGKEYLDKLLSLGEAALGELEDKIAARGNDEEPKENTETIEFEEGVWKEYPKTAVFYRAVLESAGDDEETISGTKEIENTLEKGNRGKVIDHIKLAVKNMEESMEPDVDNLSEDKKKRIEEALNMAGEAIEELKRKEVEEEKVSEGGDEGTGSIEAPEANAETIEPEDPKRKWEKRVVATESGFSDVKSDKKRVKRGMFKPQQKNPNTVETESRKSLRNLYLEHGDTRKYTVSKEVLGWLKSLATTEESRGDEKAIRELLSAVDLKTAEDLASIESIYGIKKEDYGKNQFRVAYKARFPKGMKEKGVFVIDFSEADFNSDKDKQIISVHRN